jgi:hypothetical protein
VGLRSSLDIVPALPGCLACSLDTILTELSQLNMNQRNLMFLKFDFITKSLITTHLNSNMNRKLNTCQRL